MIYSSLKHRKWNYLIDLLLLNQGHGEISITIQEVIRIQLAFKFRDINFEVSKVAFTSSTGSSNGVLFGWIPLDTVFLPLGLESTRVWELLGLLFQLLFSSGSWPSWLCRYLTWTSILAFSLSACSTTYFGVRLDDILIRIYGFFCVLCVWECVWYESSAKNATYALIPNDVSNLTNHLKYTRLKVLYQQ